jgi:hypothetical protein
MIDFNQIKPSVIRFEHGLPDDTVSWDDLQSILGYLFSLEPYDVIAYQPNPWLRVSPTARPKKAG